MIRALLLAAALAAASGGAAALSCLPPDAVRFYRDAQASAARFLIVRGTFAPASGAPRERPDLGSRVFEWSGRLTGASLGAESLSEPFDAEIVYRYVCFGYICSPGPQHGTFLAFVELTEAGPVLTTDTCNGWVVPHATDEEIARLLACHVEGKCEDGP
jgi:hypothetical protein